MSTVTLKTPRGIAGRKREKQTEEDLVAMVEAAGGVCLKFVSPGLRGVPDRLCLFPGGQCVFVELKAADGKLSSAQTRVLATLQRLGFKTAVVDETTIDFLDIP